MPFFVPTSTMCETIFTICHLRPSTTTSSRPPPSQNQRNRRKHSLNCPTPWASMSSRRRSTNGVQLVIPFEDYSWGTKEPSFHDINISTFIMTEFSKRRLLLPAPSPPPSVMAANHVGALSSTRSLGHSCACAMIKHDYMIFASIVLHTWKGATTYYGKQPSEGSFFNIMLLLCNYVCLTNLSAFFRFPAQQRGNQTRDCANPCPPLPINAVSEGSHSQELWRESVGK